MERKRTLYKEEVVSPAKDTVLQLDNLAKFYLHMTGLLLVDSVRIKGLKVSDVELQFDDHEDKTFINGQLSLKSNSFNSRDIPIFLRRMHDPKTKSTSLHMFSKTPFVEIGSNTVVAGDKVDNTGLYIQKFDDIIFISNFVHDGAGIDSNK